MEQGLPRRRRGRRTVSRIATKPGEEGIWPDPGVIGRDPDRMYKYSSFARFGFLNALSNALNF